MPKNINLNFQQAFAIKPEGVRYCRRGICRRARRCLPPPADEVTYRCPVLPHDVWVRQRQHILDMVRRAYCDSAAEWKAERQAANKAAKKASGR